MSASAQTVLAFLDPGHFHAALTLKFANPRVARDVRVYARPGPDLDAFVALIEAFNTRADAPTNWRLHVHRCADPVALLIEQCAPVSFSDRPANAAVLAGRNHVKLERIEALQRAGIPVLADKPWLTDPEAVTRLDAITKREPLARDIMTSRYDPLTRLRLQIVARPDLFGTFISANSDEPAIEIGSKHHLLKLVNGEPLARPPWYFDIGVQGDGLVDIQSHMVDQAQWLAAAAGDTKASHEYARDVTDLDVERWATPVPLDLFQACTGQATFPEPLASYVRGEVLALHCNSVIRYKLGGIAVQQRAQWGQREPEGTGDVMSCVLRGTRCHVVLEHGPHTDWRMELHLRAVPGVALKSAVEEAVSDWQDEWPGLGAVTAGDGFRLDVPTSLLSGHEQHFAMVLNRFLDDLRSADHDSTEAARIRLRYTLLAEARRAAGDPE